MDEYSVDICRKCQGIVVIVGDETQAICERCNAIYTVIDEYLDELVFDTVYGVDLGTANTAIVSLDDQNKITYKMYKQGNRPIEDFVKELCDVLINKIVALDFDLESHIYLPGTLINKSLMYFIAGAIYSVSAKCFIVSPREIRKYFGLVENCSKDDLHSTLSVDYKIINSLPNSHVKDAYVLSRYAKENV